MRKFLLLGDYVEVRAEALVKLSNMTRRYQCLNIKSKISLKIVGIVRIHACHKSKSFFSFL